MKKVLYTLLTVSIIFAACKKEEDEVTTPVTPLVISGCIDAMATNYNALATVDDDSCIYGLVGIWTPTSVVRDSSMTTTINGEIIYEMDGELLTYSGSQTMTPEEADMEGNMEFTSDGKMLVDGDEMDYTYANNVLTITDEDTTMILPCLVTQTDLTLTMEQVMDTAWVEPGFGDISISASYVMTINCSRNTAVNTNVNQRIGNTNNSWFVKPKFNIVKLLNSIKQK